MLRRVHRCGIATTGRLNDEAVETSLAAIRRFMHLDPFTGRRPVFLGDDTSDENGFDTVNAEGGISIRVKPQGETSARFAIEDVAGAIAWLKTNFGDPAEERGSATSRALPA